MPYSRAYGTEEYATYSCELSWRTEKLANTGNNLEHQVVVAVKWQIMKKNEDKQRIMRNPARTLTNTPFSDIHH